MTVAGDESFFAQILFERVYSESFMKPFSSYKLFSPNTYIKLRLCAQRKENVIIYKH